MQLSCPFGSQVTAGLRLASSPFSSARGVLRWGCRAPQFEGFMWTVCLRLLRPQPSYSLRATSPTGPRQQKRGGGLQASSPQIAERRSSKASCGRCVYDCCDRNHHIPCGRPRQLARDSKREAAAYRRPRLRSQSAAVRRLHVDGVFTTAATATIIFLAGDLANWPATAKERRRLTGVLASLFVGATAGGLLSVHAHIYAPVLPFVITVMVVATAAFALGNLDAEGAEEAQPSATQTSAGSIRPTGFPTRTLQLRP